MVGTMQNLVNEVLQSAVGNHFRNTLQDARGGASSSRPASEVQAAAFEAITAVPRPATRSRRGASTSRTSCSPTELVEVLTQREIANQEKATFVEQQRAETARIEMEKAKGTADMQAQLAAGAGGRRDQDQRGPGREAEARVRRPTCSSPVRPRPRSRQAIGLAEAKATEALGLARAAGFEAQSEALGGAATAMVAVANAVAEGHITSCPRCSSPAGAAARSTASPPR